MPIENLISLQGPLAETFSQLDPGTIQHADELTNERRTNEELRNEWLWTADGAVYVVGSDSCQHYGGQTVENAYLYLTRGQDNPIFKNIEKAVEQLLGRDHNYILKKGNPDLEVALNSASTLKTRLADLSLQGSGEWLSFEFDTKNYKKKSNNARKAVIERVFSEEGVKVLRENGIKETRIYVLNPEYVKKNVPKDGAIARACRLENFFVNDSDFDASGRFVDYSSFRLRGVPREVAEGDSLQEFGAAEAYETLLVDPVRAVQEMTPEIAAEMSELITNYLNERR